MLLKLHLNLFLLLGSWAKPLFFKPPVTPSESSTPRDYDPAAFLMEVSDSDGLQGKFHKCSLPPCGLVHAVVNRIWGRSCKIACKKLGISRVASGPGEPILTHKLRLSPTNMGEAKVLVEKELDRYFSKLIALDDKHGSIFLVNVEYTWIPSTCERCEDTSDVISIVDIDLILQQSDNAASSPLALLQKEQKAHENLLLSPSEAGLQPVLEAVPELPSTLSNASMDCQDSHSTPTITPAMEFSPSNIIYNEVQGSLVVDLLITSPKVSGFESPSRFTML
ncbi:hypothetical protein F2Q70_00009358 [Brassica cretica]|uniref:Uncharacterized protein n=1 Tax=Brassica cretica TaxID=69181 RepID=A0A8S9MAT6_BRACR|nr:hypothetical protein F2Q70_00009358 [Brassica cretica]